MGWENNKAENKPSNIIHVKSKLGQECRRFGLQHTAESFRFENFKALVRQLHGLSNTPFRISYIDPSDSGLLPINNDYNFGQAVKISERVLRIIVERKRDLENKKLCNLRLDSFCGLKADTPQLLAVSSPHDFHHLSAIIDVDILPKTHRRVLLHKHENDRPLGFAIRDGVSKRGTSNDTKKQSGIFISRLVPGGLAESTGLFEVNDEIVEVNGVDIAGMDLDQVTDLMVANCPYLIITLIPTNQNTLIFPSGGHPSRTRPLCSSLHHTNQTNASDMVEHDDQDEIVDLTGLILGENTVSKSGCSANADSNLHFHQNLF